jgi:hypothetical protein
VRHADIGGRDGKMEAWPDPRWPTLDLAVEIDQASVNHARSGEQRGKYERDERAAEKE